MFTYTFTASSQRYPYSVTLCSLWSWCWTSLTSFYTVWFFEGLFVSCQFGCSVWFYYWFQRLDYGLLGKYECWSSLMSFNVIVVYVVSTEQLALELYSFITESSYSIYISILQSMGWCKERTRLVKALHQVLVGFNSGQSHLEPG